MKPPELAARIGEHLPDVLLARGEVTVIVGRGELIDTLIRLRDQTDLSFRFLSSLTATDHPGRTRGSGSSTSCDRSNTPTDSG